MKIIKIIINSWFAILIIIIIISFITLTIYKSLFPSRINEPEYTKCTFINKSYKARGSSGVFRFSVNNINYEFFDSYFATLLPNEKFLVKYDKNNPNNCKVIFEEPQFDSFELITKSVGVISFIERKSMLGHSNVEFRYKVEGKEYKKYQFVNIESNNIKIGDKFEISYKIVNPCYSIIDLDKPIY